MNRPDLQNHVMQTYGVPAEEFDRLYESFAAFFDVTLEEFVQRRHLELQKEGRRNPQIYAALLQEVKDMRFAARGMTERQVRRLIYG